MQKNAKRLLSTNSLIMDTQHLIFDVEQAPGLSNILSDSEMLYGIMTSTFVAGLDLLPSGSTPTRHSEMISRAQFTQLLDLLATKYDYILIDSPPVLPVTDARIIGASCDGCILVLRAYKT